MARRERFEGTITTTPLKPPWFPWIGRRPFYGWVIVAVGAVTQFAQGVVSQGFTTYLSPLQKEFGWGRAALAGPRSVMQLENAILGPLEGFLMDKLGPRVMSLMGIFIVGIGLILFGLMQSLWMYYVAEVIIALGSGFHGLMVMSVAVNHWFRRKRTMANAVMGLGFAMAGVVGVPALVFLQTSQGWRTASIISGFAILAVCLPASLLLRRTPEPYGLSSDGDVVDDLSSSSQSRVSSKSQPGDSAREREFDFTLREAIRTRSFWFLTVGQALAGLGTGAVGVHLFLHLEQGVGLSRPIASLVWSVASMSNIPSRLIGGFFGDRLPKRFVVGSAIAVVALSHFILGLATSLPMAMAYAVLYGIGWGSRTPVMNAMQGEYFGRRSQGTIRGWLQALAVPLTIAAPVVAGFAADVRGDYRLTFVVMSFITLVGAVLVFLATPPKPPAEKGIVS